jgi:hypothetical protein
MLILQNVLGSILASSVFWKHLESIDIKSSLKFGRIQL